MFVNLGDHSSLHSSCHHQIQLESLIYKCTIPYLASVKFAITKTLKPIVSGKHVTNLGVKGQFKILKVNDQVTAFNTLGAEPFACRSFHGFRKFWHFGESLWLGKILTREISWFPPFAKIYAIFSLLFSVRKLRQSIKKYNFLYKDYYTLFL